MELERTHERFRTTSWSEVRALAQTDESGRQEALEVLVTRYWPAVYAFLRRVKRLDPDSAAELTQAFFADVVLTRQIFERANRDRGKLRTLLLTALQHYCTDRRRSAKAWRMTSIIPNDALPVEDGKLGEPNAIDHPFERRWAMGLLEEAMRRAETHFRRTGRSSHWAIFERRILRPSIAGTQPEPLASLATDAGFDSPALAAAAVQVVKRRIDALLREVVAETVDDPANVPAELAEVKHYLLS